MSEHQDKLSAWEAAREYTTDDGQTKFIKMDPARPFSEALRDEAGTWYQQSEGAWTNAADQLSQVRDPLGILEPKRSWAPSILDSQPNAPTEPPRPRRRQPGILAWLGILSLPIVGFLIPWGTLRVVGWVIIGFVLDWRAKVQSREQ